SCASTAGKRARRSCCARSSRPMRRFSPTAASGRAPVSATFSRRALVRVRAPAAEDAPGALIALDGDYRVGLQNFYVITRYNRSALYATAVADLADALAARVQSAGR